MLSECYKFNNFQDAPDSPKVEPFAGSSIGGLESNDPSANTNDNMYKCRPSRHLLYATHFPLPLVNSSDFNFQLFLLKIKINNIRYMFFSSLNRMKKPQVMIVTKDMYCCMVLVK